VKVTMTQEEYIPEVKRHSGARAILLRFGQNCVGATAIEYALMTFIAVAVVLVVSQLGDTVSGMYDSVVTALGQ
jgi:Flp pilus assembly pilin Flp